jgi:hypothetical protein
MGFYALIKDNRVTTVIVAEQDFIDETPLETLQADLTVAVSEAEQRPGPGYLYDSVTQTFTAPE